MSTIDSELETLRLRLAALEEQKRIEAETAAEKKANPLKTLEGILDEKKKQIERINYRQVSASQFNAELHKNRDVETTEFIGYIINMLKNIQERLEVLEKK